MRVMYVFKKSIGALASPLVFALFLVAAAGLLRLRGRRRASAWVVVAAGAVAYLGSITVIGDVLLGPLERQFPPLSERAMPQADYIVVLGSSYEPRNDIPVTGALGSDGLARIVEGIRLMRRSGSARLVISGGAPEGIVPSALGYRELTRQLGVPDSSLIVLDTPLDTHSEAVEISKLLGEAPFILVTSAYHMPRAMRLMKTAGVHPIPAPTGQRVNDATSWGWHALLPTSYGLRKTEQALHEYLGLIAVAVGVH